MLLAKRKYNINLPHQEMWRSRIACPYFLVRSTCKVGNTGIRRFPILEVLSQEKASDH